MTGQDIREQFPLLREQVYGKDLVYLDNAATSQRLLAVGRKWQEMSFVTNANIHRAVHHLANLATDEYESTRDVVRDFLHAASREEIIFTSGTTASINLVAYAFGEAFVHEGDEILLSVAEHHSNIVPWQLLAERKKAHIQVLDVDENGALRVEDLQKIISQRTKIAVISHISNVLGLVNPVKEIIRICHEMGVPVLLDGAQGIVHEAVDVQDLDCDFYAFSGHKLYAATGTGVLYGKKSFLDRMPPFMGGGEMIATVSLSQGTRFAPLPEKFEAGTQNIASVPTLKPALDFVKACRQDAELQHALQEMQEYVETALRTDPRIRLFGVPRGTGEKVPLFSFVVEGVHHEDLALILDKMGIAVRSGQMCAEPIMDRFGVTGMLRASFAPYNTMAEAEYFIASLHKAIDMLS